MAKTLEAIAILVIIWQLMSRLRRNYRIAPEAKSELKEAIEDAKNRMPNTGLFRLFKEEKTTKEEKEKVLEPQIKIEQSIVPPKSEEIDNLKNNKI